MDGYRTTAGELALARRHSAGSAAHRALEGLYARMHVALRRQPIRPLHEIWDLYARKVPMATRALRVDIIVAVSLFVLSTLLGYAVVSVWREVAALFLSDSMMLMVQNRTLWTDNLLNVMPSSLLSYELMTNNITVALTAFALGFIFGLGTLYIILLNGLLLGAAFGYTAQYDMALPLFKFVIAHGIVELSVICLSAAAGLAIGRALARPGASGRVASVREAAEHAGALAAVCIPFLIGCGLIEGYISPNDNYGLTIRIIVGVMWFVALVAVLQGSLLNGIAQIWWRARNVR